MRVLVPCAAEYGHLNPLVPLGTALVAAGHEVVFAVPEGATDRVREAGFPVLAYGMDRAKVNAEVLRRCPDPGTVAHEDRLAFGIVTVGIEISIPAMLPVLNDLVRAARPDLIVHVPTDFASPIAARLAGVPHVTHALGPLLPEPELRLALDALGPVWEQWGLGRPGIKELFGQLYIDICPPALRPGHTAQLPTTQPLRPAAFDAAPGDTPLPSLDGLGSGPIVYVTLGTFFNQATEVFSTILAGLADTKATVVVTVGSRVDPQVLGPQPDHVRVEQYIPQSLLLPRCAAVVTHGGSGTLLAALAHGLPVLVVPQGADHFHNAERCIAAGVGRRLLPNELTPGAVGEAVAGLLSDDEYLASAQRVAEEIDAMPAPSAAVAAVETLAHGAAH